ncbi:hypothetical protein ACLIBG_02535 [Virgibacillus sp. W0181]|uniref:hypothetical protein n=1 Tax=Virgibacillus sp. W0181 TaxID=3391581 RepID=UPI003F46BFEC
MTENEKYTIVGTDIEAIKEQNQRSGLSYNEAIAMIAKTTGGRRTNVYSDTNADEVRKENFRSNKGKM